MLAGRKLLVLAVFAALAACTTNASDGTGDRDERAESDIRKRINPKTGSAAFELVKPSWQTPDFQWELAFDGGRAEYGKQYERAPGKFSLVSGVLYRPSYYGFGTRGSSMSMQVPLELGLISMYTPAGIVVSYKRPITAGLNKVVATRNDQPAIDLNESEHAKVGGYKVVMLDGKFAVQTSADAKQVFDLGEGELLELILPVAGLGISYDGIDPAFGGTVSCLSVSVRADNSAVGPVYQSLTLNRETPSFTLPAGAFASLDVSSCGEQTRVPLTPDATIKITAHRLEVNDIEVIDPQGTQRVVRGTFDVQRKRADGTFTQSLIRNQPTHTGVDVTDGTYRVISTAPNVSPHVQEITFP